MSILERSEYARKRIAWFEHTPLGAQLLDVQDRKFASVKCVQADLDSDIYLSATAAIIFIEDSLRPAQFLRNCIVNARRLLNFDCRVVILAQSEAGSNLLTDYLKRKQFGNIPVSEPSSQEGPPFPFVMCFSNRVKLADVLNFIDRNPPGNIAAEKSVELNILNNDPPTFTLSEEQKLLLRRAFEDCSTVNLQKMSGGKSGAAVFQAHVEFKTPLLEHTPYSYFVKIGQRSSIYREFINYTTYVKNHVPFYLAPRLVPNRCCLSSTDGIIVGDFIEKSESLADCAPSGRATAAISSIFDRTLQGWHGARISTKAASRYLSLGHRVSKDRIEKAHAVSNALNVPKLNLKELRKNIKSLAKDKAIVGFAHNDLHSQNIRIRGTDAILIDFSAGKKDSPIVQDVADLEASLFIDGFSHENDRTAVDILKSVMPLYKTGAIRHQPRVPAHDKSEWFYSAVQQLRRYGRHVSNSDDQYAAYLAAAFLKKAAKDQNMTGLQGDLRAMSYCIAELLAAQHMIAA